MEAGPFDIPEREQPDRAAREGELFRLLVENVVDYAIFVVDPEGIVCTWSHGAERLLGYREDEILGRRSDFLFTPEDVRDGVPGREMREALATGRGDDDRWHVRKDGTRFWVSGVMTPLRDEGGTLRGFAKIMRDRTEWWRAEQARLASEARAAAILETALDAVITIDHLGRVVEFNPAAARMFGRERAEVLGRDMAAIIIPPRLRDAHRRGLAHYLTTGEGPVLDRRIEVEALRSDGREFPVELAITRIPAPGPPHFTAYLRDITGRTAEERRRTAQLALTKVLAESPSVGDAAPRILRAVCEALGWDVGAFWLADRGDDVLRCLDIWHRPDAEIGGFEASSRGSTFARGVGLPGRVWASGVPAWVADVTGDDNFPRRAVAAGEGVRGAFAFPILGGTDVLGVVEFFCTSAREVDPALVDLVGNFAAQVGQFVERTWAEEAIRASEGRFRHLADAMPQIVWVTRPDRSIEYLNRRWLDYTGQTTEEALGPGGWSAAVHPEDIVRITEASVRAHATGEPFEAEYRIRDASGGYRWHLGRSVAVLDEAGRLVRRFGAATDIDDRTRIERDAHFLAEVSAGLASIVDEASTLQRVARLAVPAFADWCSVDMAGEDGLNRGLAVAHVDPAKVGLAHELHRRYPPDPDAPHGVSRVIRTGSPEMVAEITEPMLEAGARDGDHLRILRELGLKSYMSVPLRGRDGTLGAISFVSAESGRRYGPADLRLAEDLASRAAVAIENARLYAELKEADGRKNDFLATLAHELRNPLAPIRNTLHLLGGPEGNGRMEAERAMAERNVVHLARLIDDLMDVARISRGRIELSTEVVDLAKVVHQAVETARPLIDERRQALTVAIPEGEIRVMADPTRLEQVFWNLLNNSAKYTGTGGRIRLSVEPDGGEVVVRVRDTGIGIRREMLARVFDMFVQVGEHRGHAQGGLGIGLGLVKSLVAMHGGSIAATSDGPGTGSEFVVRLPRHATSGPVDAPGRGHRRGEGEVPPRRRVLVVDDNVDAARSLARLLERLYGQEVRVAHDGPEAIDVAGVFRPEVILLDIGLPGMDGNEVARRLRGRPEFEGAMLVALTGWGQQADIERSSAAGFDRHLVKPADPEAILQLLFDSEGDVVG